MSSTLQGANALTFAANSGAFANGSTPSQFTNAALINYAINGKFYSRDIVSAGALCPVPAAPKDRAIVGAIKVSNVTNPFIPGTTLFGAAGVTTTYTNLAQHPGASI